MSQLILHIGLEKTGTTSFQAFCAENRAALAAQGVLYPANRACCVGVNHAPLAASYFSAADAAALLIAGRQADRAEAVAALMAESAGAALTLVSAEHFSSRFDPGRIAALAADLSGFETCVATVVRDPLARALSAYATTVASGRDLTLDAFVAELCAPTNRYLQVRRTLEHWAAAFGRARMIVVPYREDDDIVAALCQRLLPQAALAAGAYRRNVSPSAVAIERRRRANALGPVGRLAAAIARRLPGGTDARPALTPEQARALSDAVADDLAWLNREFGVDFRARGAGANDSRP